METLYQIACSIRALSGYVEVARFKVADNKEEAISLFNQLQGSSVAQKAIPNIRLHLIDTGQPIDTVLATLYCTLCEAGDNCETIIKETFRAINIG